MAGLKHIKGKIAAMKKSQTVTRAMEAVSAAKMRKAQSAALAGRAYARASASVLSRVSGSKDLQAHPLALEHAGARKAIYIVITSDKGLAGGLNSAVLKAVAADLGQQGLGAPDAKIIAVGKKAHDFFAARGFAVVAHQANTGKVTADAIRQLVAAAQEQYESGEYRFVKIAYQNFISTFEQRPTLRTVFPLSLGELQKVVEDIVPARGAYAAQGADHSTVPAVYTLEPGETTVLNQILPMLASVIAYHALLESQASEHSARMVAMKSATDKAGELQHALTLQFNKARQAAITREVSEITGGMEAMAS